MSEYLYKDQTEETESEDSHARLLEEKSHDDLSTIAERWTSGRKVLFGSAIVIFLCTLIMILIVIFYPAEEVPIGGSIDGCGKTPEEAVQLGCIYEQMQRSWIPKRCYTEDPMHDYQPFDDREWFFDSNLTQKMVGSDLDALRYGLVNVTGYTKTFHHEHCVYCWRKMAQAVHRHLKYIDSKTYSEHHTTHCSKAIGKSLFNSGYGRCGGMLYTHSPLMFLTCIRIR